MGRLGKVDPNSYAEPEKIVTLHSLLTWTVDFSNTKIVGSVIHKFNILSKNLPSILLDVRDIKVQNAEILTSQASIPVNFFVSDEVADIGSKLTLELPEGTAEGELNIRINYETSSSASGLQWLTPEQTLGKTHPYMFSQCQAIHARSVVPCQDTPSVKFKYTATVQHPKDLTALMSAIILKKSDGMTTFEQTIPVPAYLLAIAVGKLVSRPLGPNSNVWAEEGIIEDAAKEFSDTPTMLKTASDICGPYVWKQYDLLVMPPSFPFGGMENPCLTFVTPTIIAGDKSLVDVVAHEIAHSWTGNLVTNKNFEHFWLNEGFTVFVESKIVGRMEGDQEQDFLMIRNLISLEDCLQTQLASTPELSKLVVNLDTLGPDEAFSSVPYVKGSSFLRYIEDLLGGRQVFEPFLQSYLKKFAYKSVVTDDFKNELYEYFIDSNKDDLNKIDWDKWLYGEGMPPIIPKLDTTMEKGCESLATKWSTKNTSDLIEDQNNLQQISTNQIIYLLDKLLQSDSIVDLTAEKISFFEQVYNVKHTKNAEIRFRILKLCIKARLMSRMDEIIAFANSNFRMKFVRPIYRDLGKWDEAKQLAIQNFQSVKNQMMKVCANGIEKDLGLRN